MKKARRNVCLNQPKAVPYGYYRKPEDKQTLYVDEASASVF